VGRLLTILDKQKVTPATKTIRVRVAAEKDFDPLTDMDVDSLRFGASEEVNFGRGARAIKTERSGKDLIVTFDAAGLGLTDHNFAAKLLGKTSRGKLLFGYARLPWVNYLEPALSARMPRVTRKGDGFEMAVEVQNFGQVASKPAPIRVAICGDDRDTLVASGTVPALKSFEKATVALSCRERFQAGQFYELKVVLLPDGQEPVTLQGKATLVP